MQDRQIRHHQQKDIERSHHGHQKPIIPFPMQPFHFAEVNNEAYFSAEEQTV